MQYLKDWIMFWENQAVICNAVFSAVVHYTVPKNNNGNLSKNLVSCIRTHAAVLKVFQEVSKTFPMKVDEKNLPPAANKKIFDPFQKTKLYFLCG